jgi:hypothetical protein
LVNENNQATTKTKNNNDDNLISDREKRNKSNYVNPLPSYSLLFSKCM